MDDQRTDQEGGWMNWLTKQRQFRFGLRNLLIAFAMIPLCASAYMLGRQLGAKDAYKLGYAHGQQAADEALKAEVKRANYEHDRSLDSLVKAEREIQILKFNAKKNQIPHANLPTQQ
jgi:hypothetical protein